MAMMARRWWWGGLVLVLLASVLPAWGQRKPVMLVTPEEARLPDAKLPPYEDFLRQRDLLKPFQEFATPKEPPVKGPVIELITPKDGAIYTGPLDIRVRFVPRAADVDPETLYVEYVKLWGINITDRVRPYTTKEGIQVENAKFPSGNHTVKISIADLTGNFSSRVFTVKIR